MDRARSAHEIIGLAPLPGLPPLPASEAGAVPYADLREELADRIRTGHEEYSLKQTGGEAAAMLLSPPKHPLNEANLRNFLDRLEAEVPQGNRADFAAERQLAEQCIGSGQPGDYVPNLDTPERQLLWAATLAHMQFADKLPGNFHEHPVVKSVTDTEYVDTMLMDFAMGAGIDANVVMGPPGSWFYHAPSSDPGKTGTINIDLCNALVAGGGRNPKSRRVNAHFESLFHHENGHARFSREYPPSMKKLYREIRELADKGGMEIPDIKGSAGPQTGSKNYTPGEGVSIDEYKRLLTLQAEWDLRHGFWNAAEDNCVNRYNCNLSDPGVVKDDDWRHPAHLADSLNVAITLINYVGQNVRRHAASQKAQRDNSAQARFANLSHAVNMSFFVRNHLAPDTPEGWAALNVDLAQIPGGDKGMDRIKELTRHIELCQPAPFDEATAVPAKLKERRQKFETAQAWAQEQAGEPAYLANFSDWVSYHNTKRNLQIEKLFDEFANPLIAEIMRERAQKISEEVDKQVQQCQNPQPGQEQAQGRGIRIKGLNGTMPAPDLPGQDPREGRKKEQQGQPGGEPDKDKGESTGDLKKRRMNGTGKRGQRRPQPRDQGRPQSAPDNPLQAGSGYTPGHLAGNTESALESLQFGDGRAYQDLQNDPHFQNAVDQIARQFQYISKHVQRYTTHYHQTQHELPDSEESLERLDYGQVEQLDAKLRHPGELGLKLEDYDIAHRKVTRIQPTEGDVVLLVDGSGSMGSQKGSPMEVAMKTAALIEQAASKAKHRTFITLWVDQSPFLVVEPGMDPQVIAQNIDGIINGKQCGTQLAPSIPDALDRMMGQRRTHNVKRAYTHFIVVSDGYTYDDAASKKRLQALLDHVPNATVDAALVDRRDGSLAGTVESLKSLRAHQKPRVKVLSSLSAAPKEIVDMFEERLRLCNRSVASIDDAQYRRQLRRARDSGEDDSGPGDDTQWVRG